MFGVSERLLYLLEIVVSEYNSTLRMTCGYLYNSTRYDLGIALPLTWFDAFLVLSFGQSNNFHIANVFGGTIGSIVTFGRIDVQNGITFQWNIYGELNGPYGLPSLLHMTSTLHTQHTGTSNSFPSSSRSSSSSSPAHWEHHPHNSPGKYCRGIN